MNKAELVEALAVHFGGNRAEAGRALNAVVETIVHETAREGKVSISGFGVFEKVHRPSRVVRNPRTGERKEAAATDVPRFRPGAELKAYVAGEKKLPKQAAPAKATAPAKKAAPTKQAAAPKKAAPATKAATAKASTAGKTTAKKTTAKKTTAKKTTTKRAASTKA